MTAAGRAAGTRCVRATGAAGWWPWAALVVTVGAQIGYPLGHGPARLQLTAVVVLAAGSFAVLHALVWRGARFAAGLLVLTAGMGFAAELLGLHTGWPFGRYVYGDLGPRLAGVPLLVPASWTGAAYPALLAATRLVHRPAARVVVGAVGLAGWDLFLDPQMVAAGRWRWLGHFPALPGIPQVPLGDYGGWLLVALLMMAGLLALPTGTGGGVDDRAPLLLYLWWYLSSVLAAVAFFGEPAAAAWGGLAMGAVALPLAATLVRDRRWAGG